MHCNQILSMQFHFKLKNACKNQQWSLKFQFFFSSIQKKITLISYIENRLQSIETKQMFKKF
jgi:hypothetical protein